MKYLTTCLSRKLWVLRFKFLLSKLSYEGEEFSEQNLEELNFLAMEIYNKGEKDVTWRKFSKQISLLKDFQKNIIILTSKRNSKSCWYRFPRECLGMIQTEYAYFGLKNQKIFKDYSLIWRVRKIVKHPPHRYVGVGYKDKGTCSNRAVDGSPGWKQVATSDNLRKVERYFDLSTIWEEPPEIWETEVKIQRRSCRNNPQFQRQRKDTRILFRSRNTVGLRPGEISKD